MPDLRHAGEFGLSETGDDDDKPIEGSRDAAPINEHPNAADARAIGLARECAKHKTDQAADFWRRVLSEDIGRAVMWDVLSGLHTFETRFATAPNGFPNPEATWFQAGQQAAGWRLYDALRRADFAAVHLMHREHDNYFLEEKRNKRK